MKVHVPTKCLTWGFNYGTTNYSSARVSILIEIWDDETNTLLLKRWDKDGGVHGDNNHPDGSEIHISDGKRIKLIVKNLSRNMMPCQVMVMNSDTASPSDFSTYPTGSVNGSNQNLRKGIYGGQQVEMIFTLSANTYSWFKINTIAWFANGTMLTSTPPDSTDYTGFAFGLVYEGGEIRWNNPLIPLANQFSLPNTATWTTVAAGTAENPWYQNTGTGLVCSNLTDGFVLGYYTNPADNVQHQLVCRIFSDGIKRIFRPKIGENGKFYACSKNILLSSHTNTTHSNLANCFAFADGANEGFSEPSDFVLPPNWVYNGSDGSISDGTGAVIVLNKDVISAFTYKQTALVTVSANDQAIPSGAFYQIKPWSRKGVLVGVTLLNSYSGQIEIVGVDGCTGDGYFEVELILQSEVVATSRVEYSVIPPDLNTYTYEITDVENGCLKTLDYGLQPTQNGNILWQESQIFENRSESNPIFYIRDAENIEEVSEAYIL